MIALALSGTTLLMIIVAGAAAVAAVIHRLSVARDMATPFMHQRREKHIADRTMDLQRRAWSQDEHTDDRDLSAKLQDSLHGSGDNAFAEQEEMYLPGLGAMPTEWKEPTSPEAKR